MAIEIRSAGALGLVLSLALVAPVYAGAAPVEQGSDAERSRALGVQTSAFGTYVHQHELLVYPFFSYTLDHDREYQPDQFGVGGDVDFRGHYSSAELGLMVAYGWNDWLAFELTTAYMSASFEKAPDDPYPTPETLKEKGLGDLEGQVRVRCRDQRGRFPAIVAYLEITAPTQQDKVWIGDPDWDFKPGFGLQRTYGWGTLTIRTTGEYNQSESKFDLGESSLEYLRVLSPSWQLFFAFEGGRAGRLTSGMPYQTCSGSLRVMSR